MESSMSAGAMPEAATKPDRVRAARPLLRAGIVVGPLYLAVGLAQALLREGFDLARHPLSVLANGTGGWVQTVNFVVCGLMVVAAAIGFWRALGARWTGLFLAVFGISMVLAAIFPADPVDGFPVGTPLGFPTAISPTGLAHFLVGTVGFVCLAVSSLCAAWALRRHGAPGLAALSLFAGLGVLIGFFGGFALALGTVGIWFAVVAGWLWLSVVSLSLYRRSA